MNDNDSDPMLPFTFKGLMIALSFCFLVWFLIIKILSLLFTGGFHV